MPSWNVFRWLRNPSPKVHYRGQRHRPFSIRLNLEILEARLAPAMLTVLNNNDSGTGSLRAILAEAANGDSITFDPTFFATPQTITESAAGNDTLTINSNVTITGPAAGVTIDGNNANTVFTINSGVTATLAGLTIIDGNAGNAGGGGIFNETSATLTVNDLTITDGNGGIGGGIFNDAYSTLTVNDSVFSDNSGNNGGGGISNGPYATLTVNDSTFAANSANGAAGGIGGGIFNNPAGMLTVNDSTFAGNSASAAAGGVYNSGAGSVSLNGVIVVGNTTNGKADDLDGTAFTNSANNIVGVDNTGSLSNAADGNANNQLGVVDAGLTPLGYYGGPTQTFALLPGSIAIGKGRPELLGATDQRGAARPVAGGDAGAFQDQGYSLTASDTPQSATVNTAFALPLTATLTENFVNAPLPGAAITFTAPMNGASAVFSPSSTVTTNASGQAGVTATANGAAGGPYTVTAADAGTDAAAFSLTNTAAPVQLPPSVSVAYGSNGEVMEIVNSAGFLTQVANGVSTPLGDGGVRSASVAFAGNTEVLEVVGLNGQLTQFINGVATPLGNGGVLSASVGYVGSTQVLEVVGLNGQLTQFINGVPQPLGDGGVRSASVAYNGNMQVLEVVGVNSVLTQFTSGVPRQLGGVGVRSAGVAFNDNSEVLDIIFTDGDLYQFDAFGQHLLGMVS